MKNFTFESTEEMEMAINSGDYNISKDIVDEIINNMHSSGDVHIMDIQCEDDLDKVYEILASPEDFSHILEVNLKNFEREEDFDGCIRIQEAMRELNQKGS